MQLYSIFDENARRTYYEKLNGEPLADAFSGYAYDACLILADAVRRVDPKTAPGTPEYRAALRDAITSTHDLVGTHAVYSFTPGERYGVDERARILVKLDHGAWKLLP
jgi:branched-chain amino acid transport system substrate-binding protein